MTFAASVGVLLLGGWVLPDSEGLPEVTPSVPQIPLEQPAGPPRRESGGPTDSLAPYRYGSSIPRPSDNAAARAYDRQQVVPLPPTAPTLGESDSPWAPPTQNAADVLPGFGTPLQSATQGYPGGGLGYSGAGSAFASRRPAAGGGRYYGSQSSRYAAARPSVAQLRTENQAASLQANRLSASPVSPASPVVSKPFSGYSPSPSVSPYLNLYRRDVGAGVDNYNTLVRPLIEQRQQNQLFGGEIRGLQSTQQLQNSALQRLGKTGVGQFQQGRATNAPEFYMNYGPYYPSFSR